MTREQIENALDSGRLLIHTYSGKWYKTRRNGRTRTWKRSPQKFCIPIKFAFNACVTIDETYPTALLKITE